MKTKLETAKYTVLGPDDLWKFYSESHALFRGAGSAGGPKLIRANGPRVQDVTIVYDSEHEIEMVVPNPTKGISFADDVEKLASRPVISGHVWMLPRSETLPDGLVFNVLSRDNVVQRDHPLLNVSQRMSLAEFAEKLRVLSGKLECTDVRIEKHTGRLIEVRPGALNALHSASLKAKRQ